MLRSSSAFPTKSSVSLRSLLIGSSVAGLASLGLGATPANALTTPCSFGTNVEAPACQLNVPYDSDLPSDKQITLLRGPSTGNGTVDFDWIPLPPNNSYIGDLWEVDVDFNPDLVGPVGGTSGVFDYKINIQGGMKFDTVRLDVDALAGLPSVTKSIYSDDAFTNQIAELFVEGDGNATLDLPHTFQTLYVRDTYNVPEGAVLANFQNVYTQVPGPLPVLGAGAAFGFSRRLRRRVRQRHSLG